MANENRPRNPLDMLYQIVGDLWPVDYVPPAPRPDPAETPAAPEAAPAAEPEVLYEAAPAAPKAPPFEEYWRRADERVEWTEALLNPESPDGLTDPERWAFLHRMADRVLVGDTAAYAEVLQTVDPLGDLKPFAKSVTVSAPDSDTARVTFTALDTWTDAHRLLAGLALRCARDVLALLPVSAVSVEGSEPNGLTLSVTFQRDPLRKARFGFIDPVAFAEEQGGVFREA